MHIGVDATCWGNTRGYGRAARSLLGALIPLDTQNKYTLFMDSAVDIAGLPPDAEVRVVKASTPAALAASAEGHRSLADMWRMSRALSDPDLDVLLFPTIYSYVPVVSRARKVVQIHDIIAEKYPQLTLPSRSARLFWKIKTALGRHQADAIVAISEYSRQCIMEHFGCPGERVHVVGAAGDAAFRVLDQPGWTHALSAVGVDPDDRTVIYLGGFGPHKNLELLVDVFADLVTRGDLSDCRLVMVGEYKKEVFYSEYAALSVQIDRLGISQHVLFTGFLPDEDLVVLLNRATVLALPSLMEGLGLPAVEAAACGCPVIATTASPLPALLGEGGLYVDPLKREDLNRALEQVLRSPALRQQMRQAGIAAAGKLSWQAAAEQMKGVIEQVAKS